MARKWQKVAALGRRISPRADECSDFDSCITSSVPEKGHFFIYSLEGKRFMVPLAYLDNDIFKELLKTSEEEFGLPSDGPITMPCDAVFMEFRKDKRNIEVLLQLTGHRNDERIREPAEEQ
ncbi:hypothetical protein J5N97_001881 [Dioscorea zingiberensis]|uniref:Uncharacterized protein n=1 Tax=Dioscorea zingiberensis TaxID=325984 RepID=A0A9D5BTI0_9LILI|nr:hypothetical protein J5N97_001881 [Dioscorea zingiberensis]